jgi:hypothetical protein
LTEAADTEEPNRLVADAPEDFTQQPDAFGHSDYAATLADLLTRAPTPFTAGIFGPWGLGKSTIVREMARRLPRDRCVLVEFDAWRHEGHALRRHFLKDVATQLHAAGVLHGFDPDRELREVDADLGETRAFLQLTLWRVLKALIPAIILGIAVLWFADVTSTANLETRATETPWAVASAFVAAATFVATLFSTLLSESQRTQTIKRLDEPDRFSEKFRELLAAVKASRHGGRRRVVVAIDNLDRCSPDRVVETLGTVKTYLEPNASGPGRTPGNTRRVKLARARDRQRSPLSADAVFVIAVDDSALRRHLLAKEFAESAVLGPAPQDDDSVARARAAGCDVDEYLRKFFSVTMRVRDLLDEDMHEYTRRYLEPTMTYWLKRGGGDEGAALQAVEMTTRALGRNPRRIKQFVNTFEGRMSLIVQRESRDGDRPPRIEPPISTAPLLVAELILIEEKWAHVFARIEEDPDSLARLHERARREPDTRGNDTEDIAGLGRHDQQEFDAFLRVSPDPGETDLGPFLRLKQTDVERELQLLPAVRSAMRAADARRLNELLTGLRDEELLRYLTQLRAQLVRYQADGYSTAAAELLRTVLSSHTFERFGRELGEMVATVLRRTGPGRQLLLGLEPELLVSPIKGFNDDDAQVLMSVLRDTWREWLTEDQREAWARSLSWAALYLSPSARGILAEMVAASLKGKFPRTFRTVLRVAPELVPEDAVVRAANILSEALPEIVYSGDAAKPDMNTARHVEALWLVPIAVAAEKLDIGAAEELMRRLAHNVLARRRSANVHELLEEAFSAAHELPLSAPAAIEISGTLRGAWADLHADADVSLLKLLNAVVKNEPTHGPWATGWAEALRSSENSIVAAAHFARAVSPDDRSPLLRLVRDVLNDAVTSGELPGATEKLARDAMDWLLHGSPDNGDLS